MLHRQWSPYTYSLPSEFPSSTKRMTAIRMEGQHEKQLHQATECGKYDRNTEKKQRQRDREM